MLLKLTLTFCAVHALYRLGDDEPGGPDTACIPMRIRRVWSVLAFALVLGTWLVDSWWLKAPAMFALLMAMACRNVRITWKKKKLRISGVLGYRWTYEYAQLRYLPGKLPFIVTNNHVFFRWPGMVGVDAFAAQAIERLKIIVPGQKYRSSGYVDSKENAENRKRLWERLGMAAVILMLLWFACQPITAETGAINTRVLTEAHLRRDDRISLTFEGLRYPHRIPYNDATAALLEEDALGRTYIVQENFAGRRRASKYNQVIALRDEQGRVFRTWEESAAARRAGIPDLTGALVIFWFCFSPRKT